MRNIERIGRIILALVLTVLLGLGTGTAEVSKTEVVVFAAASLTESLTEIEILYEAEHPDIDLVFNTAPALVLDGEALRSANRSAMLIDLASEPYGIDLKAAWSLGLRAWREPGVPGRYCPESAAAALYRAILRGGAAHD